MSKLKKLIPVTQPGDSLRERRELVVDSIMLRTMIPFVILGFVITYWLQVLFDLKVTTSAAILLTGIFLSSILWAVWQFRKKMKELRCINRGIEGEVYIGTLLERFRIHGAEIYHDIEADSFNIDHLIISQKGIYLIETKNWAKKDVANSKIIFDGSTITANGYTSNEVLSKVSGYEKWLLNLFEELTGKKKWTIQKVVLFPNWYVEGKNSKDFWVLNETAFMKWFEKADVSLELTDVRLLNKCFKDNLKAKSLQK